MPKNKPRDTSRCTPKLQDGFQAGTVLWFDDKLGFGAAHADTGQYACVHYKDIAGNGHRTLIAGQIIAFRSVQQDSCLKFKDISGIQPWQLVSKGLLRNLLRWLDDRNSVRYIWRVENEVLIINMVRYYIAVFRWFEIYIHQFLSDDEPVLHDHPWSFATLIIKGGYNEQFENGQEIKRRAPSLTLRISTRLHRVSLPDECRGKTLSVVFAGKRKRKWHFVDPESNERMTPDEYGRRRGAPLLTFANLTINGKILPEVKNGKDCPDLQANKSAKV